MDDEKLVSLERLLRHYHAELSFIRSLEDYGLVKIIEVEDGPCVDKECLGDLERMIRLHYELEINLEGIDAIFNLLQKIDDMKAEINQLRNRAGNF